VTNQHNTIHPQAAVCGCSTDHGKQNFVALANWCQGEIRANESDELISYDHSNGINPEAHHIRIRVHNPKNIRQTKGFVGDWILYTDRGYKVYTQKAFKASFDPTEE
jgi:hypothetical protein